MEHNFVLSQPGSQAFEGEANPSKYVYEQPASETESSKQKTKKETEAERKSQLSSALKIAVAMPPSKLSKNLSGLLRLAPAIQEELLEKVVLPLEIADAAPRFLKTEFNRSGDSYRSPFTNSYFPEYPGPVVEGELRRLEEAGVTLFTEYTKLYYGADGLGTFLVSGTRPDCFSCGFFAKRLQAEVTEEGFVGGWDSFNVVRVRVEGGNAKYHLETTVMIETKKQHPEHGYIELTGYLTNQQEITKEMGPKPIEEHLATIGHLIEEMETHMRRHLETVYISKTKEVLFTTRFQNTVVYDLERKKLAEGLKNIHLNK